MTEILYDTNRQTFIRKYYRKHYLNTIEYDRNTLLLTIVNLVFKMYRNGTLSAETEIRNGIVAAMHASRCNVMCQTDNSDTTKLPIKPVNLEIAKFVETVRYKRS